MDTNGVCQGILFLYTVLLPLPAKTYIIVLAHLLLHDSVLLNMYFCGDLDGVLKSKYFNTLLIVVIIEEVAVFL